MKISVIGGDKRNIIIAKALADNGFDVYIFGFDDEKMGYLNNVKKLDSLDATILRSSYVIGPTPFSIDGIKLNTPLYNGIIYIEDIINLLNSNMIIIATKINKVIKALLSSKNIRVYDLLNNEELTIKNAIPTAEGAIQFAMENTPFTINASKVLVMGYGRIGKVLSQRLNGLGANVYVEARKSYDLTWIKANGYESIDLRDLDYHIGQFDIIFNTIPFLVLDEKKINLVKQDVLIVDVSSNPGGVDFEACKKRGVKANLVLGIPGKVAPHTAAKYIKDAILSIIEEVKKSGVE